ncbi:hypothetical protein, partial [Escherichia coli]|uniref:hypothetical protein n=1 Tax=Escherichia coli TaxID=562 RepID=UPI001BC83A84
KCILKKIALQLKWFFGVFKKECDEVKIFHHKPEKKSVSGCKLFIPQSLAYPEGNLLRKFLCQALLSHNDS